LDDDLRQHWRPRVYESPYDSVAPEGPETMFVEADLDRIFSTLQTLVDGAS
jgi:hypothetical protein